MTSDQPTVTGNVIRNPISGETIVIHKSAADTGGQLLAWELRLSPGGKVPSGHNHPGQEERFTVREGLLRFRVGGRILKVGPGQSVVVPPATAHHFANVGRCEARVDVETRPALQMEELLRTAAALAREQRFRFWAMPRPIDLMLFMRDFRAEVGAPYLPVKLVRASVDMASRMVERLGGGRRYRRIRDGASPGDSAKMTRRVGPR